MKKSKEDQCSWFSFSFFGFLNPVFDKGATQQLEYEDLGAVSTQDSCEYLHIRFEKYYAEEKRTKPLEKRSLWRVLWRTSGYEKLILGIVLYAIYQAEAFGPILILTHLVRYFEGLEHLTTVELAVLVALMFILPFTGSIFIAHSNAIFAHVGLQMRNVLITKIYRKALRLSPAARAVSSSGQIVNIFSSDTQQVQKFLYFFNSLVMTFPTLGVCLYLIYQQMNVATFVGLGLVFVVIPLNVVGFFLMNVLRQKKVLITDIRVKLMNEILSGVRIIKYYAWERAFSEKVEVVRGRELHYLTLTAYLVAVVFTIVMQAIPVFMPILIFFTYIQLGNTLDTARAFTAIALFNLLHFPFVFLPMGIGQFSQASIAIKRISAFLEADELEPYVVKEEGSESIVLEMEKASLGWVLDDHLQNHKESALKDTAISLEAIEKNTHEDAEVGTEMTNKKVYQRILNKADEEKEKEKENQYRKGKEYEAIAQQGGDIETNADGGIELLERKKTENIEESESNRVNRSIYTLASFNFQIKKGELVAVIGAVGSGKTSFLAALLGEMNLQSGKVRCSGSVAYCDQRAWILNDSVQGNILFGKPYDKKKFDLALYAANLDADLKALPGGLNTQIGERGINLSGGQKARVALARAIYQDADICLLDDPLSAVDAHVGEFLFQECISKTLSGKTRVLVTHHVHHLSKCDKILMIVEGHMKFFGTYDEYVDSGLEFKSEKNEINTHNDNISSSVLSATTDGKRKSYKLERNELGNSFMQQESGTVVQNPSADEEDQLEERELRQLQRLESLKEDKEEEQKEEEQVEAFTAESSFQGKSSGELHGAIELTEKEEKPYVSSSRRDGALKKANSDAEERKKDTLSHEIMTKEERQEGDVSWSVYKFYLKAGGVGWFVLFAFLALLAQLFQVLGAFWLQWWGTVAIRRENEGHPLGEKRNMYWLNIYTLFGCLSLIAYAIRSVFLAVHRIGTSELLHDKLLGATLQAPIAFFDTTPIGRILNRFSSDLVIVDEELTNTISSIANCTVQVLGAIGAIAGATKGTFLVLVVPLLFIYSYLQKYFRSGNTQVARLESISRSPIYADFSQALAGVSSIRAYRQENRFINDLERSVNLNSVPNIFQQLASNWLCIRLDFLGSLVSFFIALLAVTTTNFIPAGFLAVGLAYSFQLMTYLKFLVRHTANGEAQMNSVERIKYYIDTIPKEGHLPGELHETQIPASWPEKGTIEAKGCSMRYRDGPLVLKNVSFHIQEKEKVGVAGRTGSGKSSLMVGLFRIQELAEGKLYIDNLDISAVPLHVLRKKLGIIPQDPVMFSASVRFNLDPFQQFSDEEIWTVLENTHIQEHVLSLPSQLEEEVSEGGDNFSAGQRQLICIARAILRKPKILVLDEATASIDNETDDLIQVMIRKQFSECTVLTIAHRLNTIIDSDR
jgi:ABC-type multidrug transport system fused ATPase/permease subunit